MDWDKTNNRYKMFCDHHFGKHKSGESITLETGYTWRPVSPGKGDKKIKALSLDVVDVATGSKKSVAVDPAFVEAMIGIQAGTVKKVQEKSPMSLDALQATLDTLTDYQ